MAKSRSLTYRVEKPLAAQIEAYVAATGIIMGELSRRGVTEYMVNHPVKKSTTKQTIKPGSE